MNKALQLIDVYAARLLVVCFFLPMKWQVYVCIGGSVYFVLRSLFTRQFPPVVNYLWAFFMGSVFLLYLGALPMTTVEFRKTLLHIIERRESLLLLPLTFAIMAPVYRQQIMDSLLYFVAGCFICCVAGNADFIYHYFFVNGGMHELSHVRYRILFEAFTGIHPTYMGMYLSFAICMLLFTPIETGHRTWNILKFGLIYILLVFLLSLLAKSPLIALVFIFLHYAYLQRHILYRFKWVILGSVAAVVTTTFFIPFFRQRVGEIFQFMGKGKGGSVADNSVYVRKMIWIMDTDLVKRNWLTGLGPGRMLRALQEKYFFYSLGINFNVGYYDPHNQYFSEWISFGVFGFLMLVVTLVVQFVKAIRVRNYLYLYLLILITTTFFTETLLSRQQGVIFYSVFTSLFFFSAINVRIKAHVPNK
jgi:O-antigen ligase